MQALDWSAGKITAVDPYGEHESTRRTAVVYNTNKTRMGANLASSILSTASSSLAGSIY